MVIDTKHAHIVHDDAILNGAPVIRGTRIPVRTIIGWHRMGQSAEDILAHHPHLQLAQIYDALSYYYDHQAAIDAEIVANTEAAEQIKSDQQ